MIHHIELLQVIKRTQYIGHFVQKGMKTPPSFVILSHIKKASQKILTNLII